MTARAPGIIKPPVDCSCGRVGTVMQLEAIHLPSNKIRRGSFSQFGDVTKSNRWVLRPEYRFKHWIVECVECFYGDKGQEEMFG